MTDKKIKKILEAMDCISLQEWENLRSYFDYKFSLKETFENDNLDFETIKIFFNSCRESNP
ncbi:hypothetical protein EPT53_05885 [Fusobacterium necrophorum]|uniref:Uncharacterized protein n=1 Tax=Fusobacterium necrophorum TaxID=859 RepID=A0A4Q2KW42_9FUSO|nr:hypothetical protein EPT53_05885 [Fusobacterium necrophorum]